MSQSPFDRIAARLAAGEATPARHPASATSYAAALRALLQRLSDKPSSQQTRMWVETAVRPISGHGKLEVTGASNNDPSIGVDCHALRIIVVRAKV